MEQESRYKLVIESSINILKTLILCTSFISLIILWININYDFNYIWNISFLIPIYLVFFSSFIQLIICFWRAGKISIDNISRKSDLKSNLIFSSCITFIVGVTLFIMYILMSIIFFI